MIHGGAGGAGRPPVALATNNGDIGGGEVMLLSIAEALEALEVPVVVVGPSEPRALVVAALAAGHRVVELEAVGRPAWMRALRRWDASSREGVLWCNGLVPAVATAGRPRRIVHLHQRPSGLQRLLAPVARRGALATLVPSRYLAGIVPGSTVLPNWSRRVELPEARPREDGTTVLGFLGRPSLAKGVRVLTEALALLEAGEPGAYRLVLAGEPRFVAERERREVEAALAPVAALVDRPGWIEPGDLFSRIDLLVVPSVQPESFGLVVTEAMSAGVPVVVSDAGALPEVVGPSIGATFRAGDPRALAELIRARKKRGLSESRERDRARWNDSYSPSSGKSAIDGLLARMALSDDS